MAVLAADIAVEFDPSKPPTKVWVKAGATDIFYRGALLYWDTDGQVLAVPVATSFFAGVCMGHFDVAANAFIEIAITGRFRFANTSFTDANIEVAFAAPAAALTDNPADLIATAVGSAGVVGVLDYVDATAVSGWLNIDRRSAATNQ